MDRRHGVEIGLLPPQAPRRIHRPDAFASRRTTEARHQQQAVHDLAKPGERRNLASQILGLATRELPKPWHKKFHYRPFSRRPSATSGIPPASAAGRTTGSPSA